MLMSADMDCPLCDAEILLEGKEETGALVVCSYCKTTFRVVKTKDKLVLTEDFEE